MTKKESVEVFTGITNQLEIYEVKELMEKIIPLLSGNNKQELLDFCAESFPYQTNLSLLENGLIEED